jgi:hypothetical protein
MHFFIGSKLDFLAALIWLALIVVIPELCERFGLLVLVEVLALGPPLWVDYFLELKPVWKFVRDEKPCPNFFRATEEPAVTFDWLADLPNSLGFSVV